ncbi:MAG: hypothetical protein BGO29_13835 [Bacteroidales bacterium 36-12]|nr:MAG: hypothetical protein BGO29_13835 [Bacteroidales bacterium 36-12]
MYTLKQNIIFIIIAAIYLLTAINSNGYHHPDEHYQIIEFAGLKGGWNTGADLCWEYDAQIRPALQPMLALVVFKCLGVLGVTNPFGLALGLRVLTALFAVFCIFVFIRNFKNKIEVKYHTAFVLLSFLLWFLPAINIRFSSETWAGFTLLLSVVLLNDVQKQNRRSVYFLAGLLWGLSFEFRFQMAIALFGLFLWLIFIRKEKLKNLLLLLSGSFAAVFACTLLDSWFYGNWVFTPWNYFYSNLIEGVASHFGVAPWYYYLEQLINRPTPLIGMLLLSALLIMLFLDYKNIVLWCIIPFLIIHSLIPHKELRFLFPVVNFVPLIVIQAFQKVNNRLENKTVVRAIAYPVVIIALIINAGGLLMLAVKPACDGNINILQYIDKHHEHVNLYTIGGSNPYVLGYNVKGLTPRFYANDKVTVKDLSSVWKRNFGERFEDDDLVMLYASYHESVYLEKEGLRIEKKSIPDWIIWLDRFYKVYDKYQYIYVLYSKPSNNSLCAKME